MGEAMTLDKLAILNDALIMRAIGLDIILVGADKNPGIVKDWPTHVWNETEYSRFLFSDRDLALAIRLGDVIDIEIDEENEDLRNEKELLFAPHGNNTVSWRSRRGRHWLFKLTPAQKEVLADLDCPSIVKSNGLEFRLGLKPAQSLIPTTGSGYRTWINPPEVYSVHFVPVEVFSLIRAGVPTKPEVLRNEPVDISEQRPGDIFNESATWDEMLTPRGWTKAGGNQWRRPGKDTPGISATTDYCSTDARGGLFYCFSSAPEIEPIEPNKSYSKFELYATLEHGGNFAAAAASVMRNGYAPPLDNNCDEFDDFPESVDFPKQEIRIKPESVTPILSEYPEPDSLIYDFVLGRYAHDLIPYTEAYPPAILFQLMEVAGVLAGRRTHFLHGEYLFRLNGGTIVIGDSGVSRKGTGLHYARLPFVGHENEDDINQIITETDQVSGEGFIQAIANKPTHTMLIACEEFAGALKIMKREGNTLSPVMRKALDAKPLGIESRKNPIPEMNDAFASFIGHCTLDEFIENISLEDVRNGFLNRFQFTMSRRTSKIAFPKPVPESIKKPVRDAFSLLMGPKEFAPTVVLSFTRDAMPVYEEFYMSDDTKQSSLRESLGARTAPQVIRNASRIALLEGSTFVDARRLKIAMAMQGYTASCIDYIFSDYINADEDEILQFLLSDKNGKSWHDINEWVARWKKPKRAMKRIITRLTDKGVIVVKTMKAVDGAGRPANRFVANYGCA